MSKPEKIPPEHIHDLKQRLDLREIAARYTTLRGGREQYGPCPRCGGADRFHCRADMFFCRQCWPPAAGKGRHDVFTFAVFLDLAHGFREAYTVVCDWAQTLPAVRLPVTHALQVPMEPVMWQTRAKQEVAHCRRRLTSDGGPQGRAYLAGRGIVGQTWQAAKLGLAQRLGAAGHEGWAIALPWFYNGRITAIQYRFLQPQGQRYTRFCYARYYGETILYTLPSKFAATLVVVEGEINALSIWQATPYDVVSFGSENITHKTATALQRLAHDYPEISVWADKPTVATDLIAMMGRPAEIINSEHDANELLQRRQLLDICG